MSGKKRRIVPVIIWLLCGMVLSLSVGAMCMSKSVNFNQFYNVGQSYLVPNYTISYRQCDYDEAVKAYRISGEEGADIVIFYGKAYEWKYLELELTGLNRDLLPAEIIFLNEQEEAERITYALAEGQNIIELEGKPFDRMYLHINGNDGDGFYVKRAVLWERYVPFDWSKYMIVCVVLMAIYVVVTVVVENTVRCIQRKRKRDWTLYSPIYFMQRVYGYILKCGYVLGKAYGLSLEKSTRHGLRLTVLVSMIFCSVLYSNRGIGEDWTIFYGTYSIIFLLLAFLCYEGKSEELAWNHTIPKAWFYLLLIMTVSDFVISKSWQWAGCIMLLVMGTFIYSWNSMERPKAVIQEFATALQISYAIALPFCLICRPYPGTYRYLGLYISPNMYAFYLVCVLIAVLTSLNYCYRVERKSKKIYVLAAEMISIFYFVYLTKSRTGMLTMVILVFFWLFEKRLKMERHDRRRKNFKMIVCMIILAIPVVAGMSWCIKNLPSLLGTKIIMKGDYVVVESSGFNWGVLQVNAGQSARHITDALKNATSLDRFSSGRINIWKNYMIDMNLFGHPGKKSFQIQLPHEAFITIAYRYGVMAVIPYLILWGTVVYESIRLLVKSKDWRDYFPVMLCISYICMAVYNEMERPFGYVNWLGAYMMIGMLFGGRVEKKEHCQSSAIDVE